MEGINYIEKTKEEADADYLKYAKLVKTRKETYLTDLKKLNYHLKNGRKVLNIFDVFKKSGVNEEGQPRLAIAVADAKSIKFSEEHNGGGQFYHTWINDQHRNDVLLAEETFPLSMVELDDSTQVQRGEWYGVNRQNRPIPFRQWKTSVPLVPADYLPESNLSNYYILWEVEQWTEVAKKKSRPPGDPFLLRRISPNMFVVFAEWDLTDLEKAVLEGRP